MVRGVNALSRAHVSAPYPSKTSVFIRVSSHVFLCIFLNYQIFVYNKAKKWAKLGLHFKNTIQRHSFVYIIHQFILLAILKQ